MTAWIPRSKSILPDLLVNKLDALPSVARYSSQTVYWYTLLLTAMLSSPTFRHVVPSSLRLKCIRWCFLVSSTLIGRAQSFRELELRLVFEQLYEHLNEDDADQVEKLASTYPCILNHRWLGHTPVQIALMKNSLRSARVLLQDGCRGTNSNSHGELVLACRSVAGLSLIQQVEESERLFESPEQAQRYMDLILHLRNSSVTVYLLQRGERPSQNFMARTQGTEYGYAISQMHIANQQHRVLTIELVLFRLSKPVFSLRRKILQFLNLDSYH